MKRKNRPARRSGATLVEVMVAALILAVIAIGTGAWLTHARAQSAIQRDHRAALECAASRLEDVRAALYSEIRPVADTYDAYYLDRMSGTWRLSTTDPGETVIVNGRAMPITTTVRLMDADGGSPSYDCLRVTVAVGYRRGTLDTVALETIAAP